ncbi:MAG: flippase activity-associated protein Agl23 [Verrucomicrobiota bacterium]
MFAPRQRTLLSIAVVAVITAAALLRLQHLDLRPMHTDEAVQAAILRDIWEEGNYVYDPHDLHGPVLVLSSFPILWLSGVENFARLNEVHLRSVTAAWGVALVGLTFLSGRWLGWKAALLAAGLSALSPMLVFYARYFIMETPLVVLLLLFGFSVSRYFETRSWKWIIAGGILAGVMHATKETFVLSVAALALGIGLAFLLKRIRVPDAEATPFLRPTHLGLGLATAALTSAILVSFFFTRPAAILDSYTTYLNYLDRGSGESGHEKPWSYYLELLGWRKMEGGHLWTEGLTILLATAGAVFSFAPGKMRERSRFFMQVLSFYTILSLLIYSAIPYKTPWSILAPLHGIVLLAGFGTARLFEVSCCLPARLALALPLGFGFWHLSEQSIRANFPPGKGEAPLFANEARNPYLYSQTTTRLLTKVVETVHEISALHPDGKAMNVTVIHPEFGWPLPWYFRDFTRIGYWGTEASERIPESAMAPVIIVDEPWAGNLSDQLNGYVPTYCNLREDSMLVLYVQDEVFDQLVKSRAR